MTTEQCDVAIIGAGPYGLSIASYLHARGASFRIFGEPMGFWSAHMPEGMHLKSEGFASSLYDPNQAFTLRAYCAESGIPYSDLGLPVPREVFIAYGEEFQRRYVPGVERKKVASLRPAASGFEVTLDDGESVLARRVVVAVGLSYYASIPGPLAALPRTHLTHSSDHGPCDGLRGLDVAIVGSGASAADLAAILHESGARVQMLARSSQIRFQDPPSDSKPSFAARFMNPVTGIGPGWKLWLLANLPLVFRLMPASFRMEKVRRVLGPAPCWFTREQLVGKVSLRTETNVLSAAVKENRVHLETATAQGGREVIVVDRVIAATGYAYDVDRIAFLDPSLLRGLRRTGSLPALSSHFESSVPNLYFAGITASNTFGPLLRFAYGAGFAAPRIATHLLRTARAETSPASPSRP